MWFTVRSSIRLAVMWRSIPCWLWMHDWTIVKTSHEGNVYRGLLKCARCGCMGHGFALGETGLGCIGKLTPEMQQYWESQ